MTNEPKRILCATTFFYPHISGLSRYALILAEELAKKGNLVKVVTGKYSKNEDEFEIFNNIEINRVTSLRLGKGLITNWFSSTYIKNVYWSQILLLHFPSLENVWLVILGKILGKRVISTYHCQFNGMGIFGDWIIDQWINFGMFLSDKIIVNSIDYVEGNNLLKNFRKKIIEINPPVVIRPPKEKLQFKLTTKYTIGYLGRISHEKNIELLIEAITGLGKDFGLVIAGPENIIGEEQYQVRIDKLIAGNNLIKKIGIVNNPTDFFQSIDCLVLPSNNRLESFGMVTAEAIMAGCKVVTTDIAGIRVPVTKSGCGELYENGNVKSLQQAIKKVLTKKYENNKNYWNVIDFVKGYERTF